MGSAWGLPEYVLDASSARQLAIIILHYNNREYLPACFRSLQAAVQNISHEIWLVDNQSTDGTPDFVQREYPGIRCLVTARNGGFSYGNNCGLRHIGFGEVHRDGPPSFRYVVLLNPDTEVDPDALHKMIRFMDEHPDVGVVGPRLVRPNGELDHGCKRGEPTRGTVFYHLVGLSRLFPRSPRFARYTMGAVDEQTTADVDSVSGACQLMRGTALQEVGLMDEESFFMYGEDLDYCLRFGHPQEQRRHDFGLPSCHGHLSSQVLCPPNAILDQLGHLQRYLGAGLGEVWLQSAAATGQTLCWLRPPPVALNCSYPAGTGTRHHGGSATQGSGRTLCQRPDHRLFPF